MTAIPASTAPQQRLTAQSAVKGVRRRELIDLMRDLKLAGMRAAYDEAMRASAQRGKSTAHVLGDLLRAELAEKTARAIRHQMSAAKFPTSKTLAEFDFEESPVDEARMGYSRIWCLGF